MRIHSPLVPIFLIVTLAGYSLGDCPTNSPTGSDSSHSGQPINDCEATESIECQYDTTMPSSTSTAATSPSSSTDNSSLSTEATVGQSMTPPTNEPCPCVFINELINMKYMYLSVSQQIIFEGCLNDIRLVLVDVTLTIYEKVSKIGNLLRNFFKANKNIKALLKYKKVANKFRIFHFISTGIQFDSAKMGSLMAIQDASGANNLTIALRNETANDKCGSGSSAKINAFCNRIDKVFKKQIIGFKDNPGRKLGHFKQASEKNLFFLNPSLEQCVRSVKIKGFGEFDQFLEMAGMYDLISSLGFTVVNGTPSQCVLIQKLQTYLNDSSTVNSTSPSVLLEAKAYVNDLIIYFGTVTDIVLRLRFIVSQASTKSEECRTVLYAAQITDDLDFADIHSGSIFSANNNVNATAGPPSQQLFETVMIEPVYNISDVEEGFNDVFFSLNQTMQNYIKSYKNAITYCIRSLYPGDYIAKLNCVKTQIQGIVGSRNSALTSLKQILLDVEFAGVLILETTGAVVFGTFRYLCGCGN